jgi:hypothetical protein
LIKIAAEPLVANNRSAWPAIAERHSTAARPNAQLEHLLEFWVMVDT